jgi:hypothetical protein
MVVVIRFYVHAKLMLVEPFHVQTSVGFHSPADLNKLFYLGNLSHEARGARFGRPHHTEAALPTVVSPAIEDRSSVRALSRIPESGSR